MLWVLISAAATPAARPGHGSVKMVVSSRISETVKAMLTGGPLDRVEARCGVGLERLGHGLAGHQHVSKITIGLRPGMRGMVVSDCEECGSYTADQV